MRVPLAWLREYCDPGLGVGGIGDALDLTGTEIERVEAVGVGEPDRFVIGKVLAAEPHPDADRLKVCTVDVGDPEGPQTIVCGAPNVAGGQTVAVALPGAVMPDGTKLGRAKLRGVVSNGMILAERELGFGGDAQGIMVLDDGLSAGGPLDGVMAIADQALELEITPNRPDCLSVYGVARELHAATGAPLAEDPAAADAEPGGPGTAGDLASVEIVDPDVCLRFTARVFDGVQVRESPYWLRQRLVAAGQRPISNVVDITNYVMLLTGQPMHAFDLDAVDGGRIVVRRAGEGERMTTLDGVERTLEASMALVCDGAGPAAIAGIMGGQDSEVSAGTTRVLMEAATWVGPNVLKTSKALGLRSEASTRFEKQLHPEQAIAAQRLAARLMVELCGARPVPGTIDAYPEPLGPTVVPLDPSHVERLLGVRIPDAEIARILAALGFELDERRGEVTVPAWRDSDVRREADLIEEIVRIHGLDRLPTTLPARRRAVGRLTHPQRLRRRVEDALRDRGLDEVVGWSFTAPATLERLGVDGAAALRLANPLSEDHSVMRPLLLPGLLDAARRNLAHGAEGVALFESAHVYRPREGGAPTLAGGSPGGATPAAERHHLAGFVTRLAPGTWRAPAQVADFFTGKGLVEAVLASVGAELSVARREEAYLHPGRAAAVLASCGGDPVGIGWVGELHPIVAREWDLPAATAFELDLDALAELTGGTLATYADVAEFPAVLIDVAVVAPADVPAESIEAAARRGGGELLAAIRVFDVYEGEQVGEGNRSLALRLEFRAADRTLAEEDVQGPRQAIERALEKIGGRIRG